MSTTKLVSSVAGAIVLLAILGVVHERSQAHVLAASVEALTVERDALKARAAADEGVRVGNPAETTAKLKLPEASKNAAPDPADESARELARRTAAWQATSPVNVALEHPDARPAFVAFRHMHSNG